MRIVGESLIIFLSQIYANLLLTNKFTPGESLNSRCLSSFLSMVKL